MTEEEALYLLKEYSPIIGFVKYRKALKLAEEALEKQIKLKELIDILSEFLVEEYEKGTE